ncbi:MAG: hypothetical protein ABIK62_07480 [candidate division WOR-3 bacterium]
MMFYCPPDNRHLAWAKGFIFFCALLLVACRGHRSAGYTNLEHASVNFWKDSTFHQTSIDLSNRGKGLIRARVDGIWQEFKVQELPRQFLDWSFSGRHSYIEHLRRNEMPPLSGPHNGIVASHGLRRNDSRITINNAVKGMGFLPRAARLPELLKLLESTWGDPTERKLEILDSLYVNHQDYYERDRLVSLELYSKPSFETHTFLNEMADPGVAIVFLDMKSFEVRALAQLLHPKDPNLSEYERQVVDWCNKIHDYFHGDMPWRSIAVVYHVIEVFDNSPGRMRGVRVVPALP